MLLLYWFGQIAGDLIGDRRILPIYTYGAILGGFLAVIISSLIPGFQPGHFMIMGATAPVMAIIVAAATLAPEYSMRLVLIGNVRIKFIAMVLILFQILGIASKVVAGGALAGLGGAATGFLFIHIITKRYRLSAIFHRYNRSKPLIKRKPNKKSKIVSIFDSVKKYESSSNRQQNPERTTIG
jgi:membrane associated rhomboid family serine protease